MKAKGARLTLVFADCCNNKAGVTRSLSLGVEATFMRALSSKDHYLRLFSQASGSGIITSSSPGEYAAGTDFNSRFSLAFSDSLNNEVSSSNTVPADWVKIYSSSKSAVILDATDPTNPQTPMYESNITYP